VALTASLKPDNARRTAGRRAFFLTLSVTQRDPFDVTRRGATGVEVVLGEVPVDAAGEQCGRGGKISADQARALCGRMVSSRRQRRCIKMQPGLAAGGAALDAHSLEAGAGGLRPRSAVAA